MRWWRWIGGTLRSLFRKAELDRELDAELRSYLDMLTEEKIKAGLSPQQARRQARIELGGMEQVKMKVREARFGTTLETVWQDLRYGLRMLRKNPGFTTVAVLTLALGIGANTAIFSVVNGVLLRPLPYFEPDRLVQINPQWNDSVFGTISPRAYFGILERTESFQTVAIHRLTSINLFEDEGEPERVAGARMTPSLLDGLGIRPALGRALQPGEEFAGSHRVALLSDRLWKRRFGADPAVLGRSLKMSNNSYEIIGVLPQGFAYPNKSVDIWIGYGIDRANLDRRGGFSSVLARLREGTTLETAQAELDTLSAQFRKEFPDNYPEAARVHFVVRPLTQILTGSVRPALLILMGAVGFVLLIACANVANLLLARISGREKEIAIRAALGASRGRIMAQILTESSLLSLLGGLGALVVATAAVRGLAVLHPESVPRLAEVEVDTTVLLFNLGLIAFVTLAVGLIPALRVS
ncbi:MAG: ABC transporter permease, partial [Candidatus Acidiferrales bacterium]